jgi:hypothetical protein
MELVDRYLKTVGTYLPKEQKEDILRELSENIRSEIEDKESELGRPLNEAEQEAVVKKHGNPLLVAGRYRQDQRSVSFGRQWIGPEVFPLYAKVLSFNLGLSSLVIAVLYVAMFAAGRPMTVGGLIQALLLQVLIQGGIITAIFATVNTQVTKHPDRWDPRKVGNVAPTHLPAEFSADGAGRVSRAESAAQFILAAAAIIWLRSLGGWSLRMFGALPDTFALSPVWREIYWPTVLVLLAGMTQAAVNLVYPEWIRFRAWMHMGTNAASLAIVYFLMQARVWVTSNTADAAAVTEHRNSIVMVNQGIFYGLVVAGVILICMLITEVRRMVRGRAKQQAALAS